jgi:hypothetical protein
MTDGHLDRRHGLNWRITMTGFNMPPGVSVRDIPGNDAPDPSPESEEVASKLLKLLEPFSYTSEFADINEVLDKRMEEIVDLVENLAVAKAAAENGLEDWKQLAEMRLRHKKELIAWIKNYAHSEVDIVPFLERLQNEEDQI